MTNTQATSTKLKTGAWGATVQGSVTQGETITITARSGKSWTARVASVVWRGNGVTIVATQKAEASSTRGRLTGCLCGSRVGQPRSIDCATCQIDG